MAAPKHNLNEQIKWVRANNATKPVIPDLPEASSIPGNPVQPVENHASVIVERNDPDVVLETPRREVPVVEEEDVVDLTLSQEEPRIVHQKVTPAPFRLRNTQNMLTEQISSSATQNPRQKLPFKEPKKVANGKVDAGAGANGTRYIDIASSPPPIDETTPRSASPPPEPPVFKNAPDENTTMLLNHKLDQQVRLLKEQNAIQAKALQYYQWEPLLDEIEGVNSKRPDEIVKELARVEAEIEQIGSAENEFFLPSQPVTYEHDSTPNKRKLEVVIEDDEPRKSPCNYPEEDSEGEQPMNDDERNRELENIFSDFSGGGEESENDIQDSGPREIVLSDDDEYMEEDDRFPDPPIRQIRQVVQSSVNEIDVPSSDMFEEIEQFLDKRTNSSSQPAASSENNTDPMFQKYTGSFSWDSDVKQVLQDTFKLPGFRQNQLQAVNATLDAHDVLVLMPTGGGKSLCYQLPALVRGKTHGVSIVISPLISLMTDQVDQLSGKGVRAGLISSGLSSSEKSTVYNMLNSNDMQVLYVAPEGFMNNKRLQDTLHKLHDRGDLARIVIDEAHCMSSWGHDFRPDYKELVRLKTRFKKVPIMALTATATAAVQDDIKRCLNPNPLFLHQSFNRNNLYYEVRDKASKSDTLGEMSEEINKRFKNQTGIIYCYSRVDCENAAKELARRGIRAAHYHAGLPDEQKKQTQSKWQSGQLKIICATIAFGMGIDKPDVRFVMHLTLPKSLEGYYQETGRAGRDGKQSTCIMFYDEADATKLQRQIQTDKDLENNRKVVLQEMLHQVVSYCRDRGRCRRAQVLEYFDEKFDPVNCNRNCDNCCNGTARQSDYTEHAKNIAELVTQMGGEKVTGKYVVSVYLGSQRKEVVQKGHDKLDQFGRGRSVEKLLCQRLVNQMTFDGYLTEYAVKKGRFSTAYVKAGNRTQQLLNNQAKVLLNTSSNLSKTQRTSHTTTASDARKRRKTNDNNSPYFANNNNASSSNTANKRKPARKRGGAASASASSRGGRGGSKARQPADTSNSSIPTMSLDW